MPKEKGGMVAVPHLTLRPSNPIIAQSLENAGIHKLLARLWASRGIVKTSQNDACWGGLLSPSYLMQAQRASRILADAIQEGKQLLIVADYDCDGATACAVGTRALKEMGANVDFVVPNRLKTGYGLSPEIVLSSLQGKKYRPDLIITVDNGIASFEGVATANSLGVGVIITDHHLPGENLPPALAIVNPNQPNCSFPSKNLAGVGVIFYLMLALRAELRKRGVYKYGGGPKLDTLADLVALGTIADVVNLDSNNRLLVRKGLQLIRSGMMQPGVNALFKVSNIDPNSASVFNLSFCIGPRINAAGRLGDMSLGIRCLITNNEVEALEIAHELDNINRERKSIETQMRKQAFLLAKPIESNINNTSVCVFNENWHLGIIGLIASRLKEKFWCPALVFAPSGPGKINGSGRSISNIHLRDVLDLISKRYPKLIQKFGGHAMAVGLTLERSVFPSFVPIFDAAVREIAGHSRHEQSIETDGSLETHYINTSVADMLSKEVWGTGFAPPLFLDIFLVVRQYLVKKEHLKLILRKDNQYYNAIWFRQQKFLAQKAEIAYKLEKNIWNGSKSVQLVIEYAKEI